MEGILLFFAILFGSVIIGFFLLCGMSWLLSLGDDDDDDDDDVDDDDDDDDDDEDDDDDDEDDCGLTSSSRMLLFTAQMCMLSTIFH